MTIPVTEDHWEQMWLPLWPLASDDLLTGVYRGSRDRALGLRYIETNPDALSNLLVIDIDHPDALERTLWHREGLYPNIVVENPTNGHAHAVWALKEPVTRTEYARRKPLAYATAVTEGLRRSVDGDKGYSGLLTKNPTHHAWESHLIQEELYSLKELEQRLEKFMPAPSWVKTRRKNPVGLGRNCSIFESARIWAYREVRKYFGNSPALHQAITAHVHELNAQFNEPLPRVEAGHIANSIHRWLVTQSRIWLDGPAIYEATFTTIQAARGHKSGIKRLGNRTPEELLLALQKDAS